MSQIASMPAQHELTADQLFTPCRVEDLGPAGSVGAPRPAVVVGQARAVEAIGFGIAIERAGFNLFVLGPTGSGRAKLTRDLIARSAEARPVPRDVCYVYDFDKPRQPRALELPPGQATRLRAHVDRLIEELQSAIPAMFDSQSYRERKEAIEQELKEQHEQELKSIVEDANRHGVAVVRTPSGFVLAPMREGEVLDAEQQQKLTEAEQKQLEQEGNRVHERLHDALRRVPQLQRAQRDRTRRLDQEVTRATVQELLSEVRRAFGELPQVIEHIDAMERDLVDKASQLLQLQDPVQVGPPIALDGPMLRDSPFLRRYRVNVLVDHSNQSGAPVVVVDHPTSGNLVGKVEYISQLGVLVTDFNLIKPGALHKAKGGYAIIDARRLLMQPVAYEQLKRTLREGVIRIESVAEALDMTMTVSLEPEPVPFHGKVVLIGEPWIYHRLSALDPEFEELFKVAADFESDMERTPESCSSYAALLANVVHREQLRPLEPSAAAAMIEHASRLCEDSTRLSMLMRPVFDLLREANHWAEQAGRETIARDDVERALALERRRHGRLRERLYGVIADGTLRVDTAGAAVGQINGISVMALTRAAFGVPSRISARVRLGKGEVVDIEREVQMGGPTHSKGVLILSAFLGGRYLRDKPLSLRATLVFEQMYGYVDGDSASLAELLGLLSAIAELPVPQAIAVTGSVDQHGRVQAVGGVNEKIEGFFDVCNARGLRSGQGVVIPHANVKHLMLRKDVVAAVAKGEFHVFAVSDVDQALGTIFGMQPGERTSDGKYPAGTVNHAVEARLEAMAAAALAMNKPADASRA